MSVAIVDIAGVEISGHWSRTSFLGNVIYLSTFGIPIAFAGVVLIGCPLHALLQKLGKTAYWYYVIPAITSGAVFARAVANYNHLLWYVLSIVCAAVVASAFWLLVRSPGNTVLSD